MKIGVIGAAGRMGRAVIEAVMAEDSAELAAGLEHAESEHIGADLGALVGIDPIGITVSGDPLEVIEASDAVINFSTPETSVSVTCLAAEHNTISIIGTTGLSDEQQAQITEYAQQAPIVLAPNMSVGVNILTSLVEKAAATMNEEYDIEIIEMHHKHKVDAPSGTALALGRAAATGRNVNLDDVACYAREGHTGERKSGEIGFATLRGGDVVGDHTVVFAGPGERIEITHKAADRSIFARGAVRAALWANGKSPALYSMQDVLGL